MAHVASIDHSFRGMCVQAEEERNKESLNLNKIGPLLTLDLSFLPVKHRPA